MVRPRNQELILSAADPGNAFSSVGGLGKLKRLRSGYCQGTTKVVQGFIREIKRTSVVQHSQVAYQPSQHLLPLSTQTFPVAVYHRCWSHHVLWTGLAEIVVLVRKDAYLLQELQEIRNLEPFIPLQSFLNPRIQQNTGRSSVMFVA